MHIYIYYIILYIYYIIYIYVRIYIYIYIHAYVEYQFQLSHSCTYSGMVGCWICIAGYKFLLSCFAPGERERLKVQMTGA